MREGSGELPSGGGSERHMPEKSGDGEAHRVPAEIRAKIVEDPLRAEFEREHHADREQERRVSVNTLAINLLRLRNPQKDRETIAELFHARTDTYTKPFEEAYRDARSEHLEDLEDAVGIVRFYMDNPKLAVPTKVVVVDDSVNNPSLSDDPDEKVLVYLKEPIPKANSNKGDDTSYAFSSTRKVGWQRKAISHERPDVFIKDISNNNTSFSLTGADNVIIGDSILSLAQYYHNKDVSIEAVGKVALLPSQYLTGGGYSDSHSRKIKIHTEGDFVQYPGGWVAVQELTCNDYIQKGGEIKVPTPDVSVIECSGEFIHEGGKIAEEPGVKIRDSHFYEAGGVSPVQERIIQSEAGIISPEIEEHAKEVVSPEIPTGNEEEQPFEEKYSFKKEGTRSDGTVIRAYNLGFIESDDYVEFAFAAEMEGWNISSAQEVNGEMCVTLRKPSANE